VSTPPATPSEIVRYVAGNVATLRKARGWTQEMLGERAQLAPRYLQRVERGTVIFSVVVLVQLARALSVPASRLLRPARLTPARRGRPPTRPVPGAR